MSAPAKPDLPLAVRPTRSGAGLLIIAHGERGGAAENSLVHDLVTRLRASSRFARVEAGFIRSEPPLEEAAARLSGTRMTVYPLFMSDGYYVRRAIPERLAASGHAGTGAPSILPPLGLDARRGDIEEMVDLVPVLGALGGGLLVGPVRRDLEPRLAVDLRALRRSLGRGSLGGHLVGHGCEAVLSATRRRLSVA